MPKPSQLSQSAKSPKPARPTAAASARRTPQQRRSHETVAAVLDAAVAVVQRRGVAAVTTNRIAAIAGVSVGSIYQYFPDKRAIFAALHDRHVAEIAALVDHTLVEHAAAPLDAVIRALVEALVEAHGAESGLHALLAAELPIGAGGNRAFQDRLRSALRLAIAASADHRPSPDELDRLLFVLPLMIDALAHGVALERPPRLSLAAAKREAVRAVLAYLHA
jgi:AcrR family transcriptional regulator